MRDLIGGVLILFLKGALLGFALAAPVGPINLLCMKRSLEQGRRAGYITGLGAATADTLYGAVAAFGLTFISDWLEVYRGELSVIGGTFFFILGILLIRKRSVATAPEDRESSRRSLYFSTVALTLSNPAVVFSFLTAFAAIKLNTHDGDQVRTIYAVFATIGVFCGSMIWWIFLATLSSKFRKKLDERAIRRINIGAGILLIVFALVIVGRGARDLALRHPASSVSSIR
jgi:threonine/homoserine/homoserine lactone efflux protein